VLLNYGGGFLTARHFSTGMYPVSITTGDFNADGKLDLATANPGSGNVSVLLGDGAGGFSTPMNFGNSGPYSVTTGDFNADGKLDLATANGRSSNSVSILLNTCGGLGSGNPNVDSDNDGIPDTCDVDSNPGAADVDRDGIVDSSACDTQIGPPVDKDQCRNNGWQLFNVPRLFRNQGECIQFVNTGR
jgi:hypothetical protein